MALTIADHRTANLEDDNRKLRTALQIAAHPQDSYTPDDNEKAYMDSIYKKLNINKEAGKDPVDVFKDGIQGEFDLSKGTNKGMMIAHQGHTPESTYDDYGRPEAVPRYKGGNPGGQLFEIPWMKEEYKKKHPELEKLHNKKYHQAKVNYGKPTPLDEYFKNGGYPTKEMSPEDRLKIMRGAPKA